MTRRALQYRRATVRLRGRSDGAGPARLLGGGPRETEALPRGVIVLLGLACVVVAVAGLRSVADILAPVFLALMLTVTASPLGTWMRGLGAPAWSAALGLVVTVYLVLFGLGGALVLSVTRLVDLMPQYQDQFTQLRGSVAAVSHAARVMPAGGPPGHDRGRGGARRRPALAPAPRLGGRWECPYPKTRPCCATLPSPSIAIGCG